MSKLDDSAGHFGDRVVRGNVVESADDRFKKLARSGKLSEQGEEDGYELDIVL